MSCLEELFLLLIATFEKLATLKEAIATRTQSLLWSEACQQAGATGLVGTRLVERLLREGATVRVLTRNVGRARQKCPGAQDVFGPEGWPQAVLGADAVINLAGVSDLSELQHT